MTCNTINDDVTMAGGESALLANRYRIVRQLGRGGMGSVWLAEDIQLDNKQFAIKMLPSILVLNKRAYRQLKDEALVAMKLVHPSIVQLRAFEENNGNPFLVMDYIDGDTLDDHLAEKDKLSEDEAVRILKPIAAALDYAHGEGVVHRDVKPANIMIRKDGHPYILDFGIAREIQETMTRVTGKLSSGTLLYMSPEQLNGDAPKPAQDVYSFAAMAYECLKGEPPFSRGAIEDQIKNKHPEPLTGEAAILAAGVMSGLAKKPEDRPATCLAVLEGTGLSRVELAEALGRRAPLQPPSMPYTQADSVRLMAEAKVVQRHMARFADDFECKKEIQEIEDDFVRAEAIFAAGQWTLAAECYARIVERGKELEEGVARRVVEENIRHKQLKSECLMDKPKTGDVKTITLPGGVTMEMVYCASGEFFMGNDNGDADEKPRHKVRLTKGFWLGRFQVTQKQWQSVMGNNPAFTKGDDFPVEMVSWNDCHEFTDRVNAQLNCGARLPTEAEWEYACRAGSDGNFGGTGNIDDMGWFNNTVFGFGLKLHPVGQKGANAWGFFDMHGNVWEWCNDCYDGDYYKKCPVEDPMGSPSPEGRVVRGGSWMNSARGCRSSNRFRYDANSRFDCCGFRLCCSGDVTS